MHHHSPNDRDHPNDPMQHRFGPVESARGSGTALGSRSLSSNQVLITSQREPSDTDSTCAFIAIVAGVMFLGVIIYAVIGVTQSVSPDADELPPGGDIGGEISGSSGAGPKGSDSGATGRGDGKRRGVGRGRDEKFPPPAVVLVPGKYQEHGSPETEKPVKEYVCTVGGSAVVTSMYPTDGLCDYLYYTYIFFADNTTVSSTTQTSWSSFKKNVEGLSKTGAGIALDNRYITVDLIRNKIYKGVLATLSTKNIKHYGLLNVVAQDQQLAYLLTQAAAVIEELKNIQAGDKSRKTILALGMPDYSKTTSWHMYQSIIKQAIETTQADTVIAISSNSIAVNKPQCLVVPPLAITSELPEYPSLDRFGPLVSVNFPYTKPTAIVGLSMDMAILTYELEKDIKNARRAVYEKCINSGMASADLICAPSGLAKQHKSSTLVGFARSRSRVVFTAETIETIEEKVDFINGLKPRSRFAWLLFNVHLTDIDRRCLGHAHARIAHLKTIFEEGSS